MLSKIALAGAAAALALGGFAIAQDSGQPQDQQNTGAQPAPSDQQQDQQQQDQQQQYQQPATTAAAQPTSSQVTVTMARGTEEPVITTINKRTGFAGGYTGAGWDRGYYTERGRGRHHHRSHHAGERG
jgi:hypothetical protein